MRSDLAKVLHHVANRPMIQHVLAAAAPLRPARTVVVIAPGMDDVAAAVAPATTRSRPNSSAPRMRWRPRARRWRISPGDVLILYGDAPLVTTATLAALLAERRRAPAAAAAVLGMRPESPGAYGRLVLDRDGALAAIVEAADCTPEQRALTLCNSGLMAVDGAPSLRPSRRHRPGQRQGRALPHRSRRRGAAAGPGICRAIEAPADELMGVNSRADLAAAEAAMQAPPQGAGDGGGRHHGRARDGVPQRRHAASAATASSVPSSCSDRGSRWARGSRSPPSATSPAPASATTPRSAPSPGCGPVAELEAEVHLGNFVEVKNSRLERGVKANHLTYIGDSRSAPGPMSVPARSPAITTASTSSAPRSARGVFVGIERVAGGAGRGRRRRLHRRRQRRYRRRAGRFHGHRARAAGGEAGPGVAWREERRRPRRKPERGKN